MRKQVKGEDTHGKPVGGGVGGEWEDLDVHRKHNKAEGFYIKKERKLPPSHKTSFQSSVMFSVGLQEARGRTQLWYLANTRAIRTALEG